MAFKLLNILIVDEHPLSRRALIKMLNELGQTSIREVDTTGGALNTLRHGSFDLVISDLHMCYMDGTVLAHAMKNDENLKTIPIIIIGHETNVRDHVLEIGADRYLVRPITEPLLNKILMELF